MSKMILTVASYFLFLLMLVVFADIFMVQSQMKERDQLDTLLTKKVAIARAYTPEVDAEVANYLANTSIDYSQINFNGSTTEPVAWGEPVRIYYEIQQTLVQKGVEFFGIEPIRHKPRELVVVANGRGIIDE